MFFINAFVISIRSHHDYDGFEYRFIRDVTQHYWDLQPLNVGDGNNESFSVTRDKVEQGSADLALCAMWMLTQSEALEMSNFIDLELGTFLVPKPAAFASSSFFYLSLTFEVWMALSGTLVVIVVMQTVMLACFLQQHSRHSLLEHLVRSILDVTSVVTGHGMLTKPVEVAHRWLGLR